MVLWLRETRRGLTLTPPRQIPPNDALAIDEMLADAWNSFVGAHSPWQQPSFWTTWCRGTYLTGSLARWTTLDGHGPLQSGSIAYGPLVTDHIATLAHQTQACFNQFVPLGNPDNSQALLALGVSEDDNSQFAFNQKTLWEQASLKPSPMTQASVAQLGVSSTVQPIIP